MNADKKKILVTGGAGFIGSNLVDELIELGHEVVIVDNLSTGKKEYINEKAKFYLMDIRSELFEDVFKNEKFDVVYHMAAQIDVQASMKNPMMDSEINIGGTVNVAVNCGKYGVEKLIYSSTAAAYGNPEYLPVDEVHKVDPISFYGISKFAPEMYIRVLSEMYGYKFTVLRYANVYGVRQDPKGEGGVVSIFMDKLFKGETPVIYGDGTATRDFLFVKDIVSANIKSLTRGDNEIFNIGTGIQTSVNQLANKMVDIINPNATIAHGEERNGDIKHSYFDIKKACEELGWSPEYNLDLGLDVTIKYYRDKQN